MIVKSNSEEEEINLHLVFSIPSVCALAALATSTSAMSMASVGERGSSLVRPITNTRINVSSFRQASPIMWNIKLKKDNQS